MVSHRSGRARTSTLKAGPSSRTPLLERSATLRLRADGSLRIAVVADTHSVPHKKLLPQLRALAADAILHAGDIGDLGVIDRLAEVAPVLFVRGNIDVRAPNLPDVLHIDVASEDAVVSRILLLHIGVNGPRLRADVARRARAEHASLVVCGHSHVPFIGKERELFVFNPGSAGPRRFQLPIVFGMLQFSAAGMRFAHFDCETARAWTPPAFGERVPGA